MSQITPAEYLRRLGNLDEHELAAEARVDPAGFDRMRQNLLVMIDELLAMNAAMRRATQVVEAAEALLAGEGSKPN